jgi:four helix bundle protein
MVAGYELQVSSKLELDRSVKSYRELEIYTLAKQLAVRIHELSLTLPKHELYEEGSQIRRSSKAIAALIVEGYGRGRYKGEFIKYLTYSHAECDETILHLEFLFETKSMKDEKLYEELNSQYNQLGRKINKFIQWVEEHWNENP